MSILQELLQKLHTAKLWLLKEYELLTGVVSQLIHYNSLEEKDWFLASAVSVEDNLRCKNFLGQMKSCS